jgi:hypothetical protein
MSPLQRWIASLPLTPLAVMSLQGIVPGAHAFTDTNAELKEAELARPRVVTAKANRPAVQTVWVPTSPKKLDGFKPVLPAEPEQARTLAKADVSAPARR